MTSLRFFTGCLVLVCSAYLISCQRARDEKSTGDTATEKADPGQKKKATAVDGYKVVGDSLLLPTLKFKIELSKKAARKLEKEKETIVVQAYLSGVPREGATVEPNEMGELNLGSGRVELKQPGTATFRHLKISSAGYKALQFKDFQVLINVFSGRRSTEMNLLDCEIVQQPIHKLKGKTVTVHGKLITE